MDILTGIISAMLLTVVMAVFFVMAILIGYSQGKVHELTQNEEW